MDAGDIIQTFPAGRSSAAALPRLGGIKMRYTDFRHKSAETHKGIQAMDAAISELSTKVHPKDAGRAMYLISAPPREINMDLVKELGEWLKDLAPNAIIRNGDYPVGKTLDIILILSELADVEIVRTYYGKSAAMVPIIKLRQEEVRVKMQGIDDAGKDIPTVL